MKLKLATVTAAIIASTASPAQAADDSVTSGRHKVTDVVKIDALVQHAMEAGGPTRGTAAYTLWALRGKTLVFTLAGWEVAPPGWPGLVASGGLPGRILAQVAADGSAVAFAPDQGFVYPWASTGRFPWALLNSSGRGCGGATLSLPSTLTAAVSGCNGSIVFGVDHAGITVTLSSAGSVHNSNVSIVEGSTGRVATTDTSAVPIAVIPRTPVSTYDNSNGGGSVE